MSVLKLIDQISFKKLLALSFVIALVAVVPISVWMIQQQTKTNTKAYFEKPEPIVPGKKYGNPSVNNPQITLVWPFLGKVGDVVLIHGQNLGDNPLDKRLRVGNTIVLEDEINKWTPDLIEFVLPKNAASGNISLTVAGKQADWPYPFTIYTLETKTQVTENNDIVKVLNGPAEGKIEIFFNDNQVLESQEFLATQVPGDKTIISIQVKDKNNHPIDFFVEPSEFGF